MEEATHSYSPTHDSILVTTTTIHSLKDGHYNKEYYFRSGLQDKEFKKRADTVGWCTVCLPN